MLMNYQPPVVQDPSTQQQLQNMQLQQALAQQPQQPQQPQGAQPPVQSPWQGASMLVNALMSSPQGQGPGQGSTTNLQNLLGWLNGDVAGGPDDSAGGS